MSSASLTYGDVIKRNSVLSSLIFSLFWIIHDLISDIQVLTLSIIVAVTQKTHASEWPGWKE